MYTFSSTIEIIGVNPYVEVPDNILKSLQKDARKDRGPIPVKGTIQKKPYIQTVVKFAGLWRLYINGPMIQASQTNVGDKVTIEIAYDPKPRTVPLPKALEKVLNSNKIAKANFERLPPYRQKEIARYLGSLKSDEAINRNIEKIMRFLTGKKVDGVLFYKLDV